MVDLEVFFLIIGAIILIGFSGRLINKWTKIPESLYLILFGLAIGPLFGLVDGSALLQFLPIVSIAAMVVILVESGVSFDISKILGSLGTAAVFTVFVALLTTALIAGMLVLFFGWNPLHAALLGIISSGTTTVTAMALLRGIKVNEKVSRLIILETIINDFTLILGTFLLVDLIKFSEFDISLAAIGVLYDLSIGIFLGFVFSFIWGYVLENINIRRDLNYASTIGLCFLLYYIAKFTGGNAIIAIFAFSLLLGNYYKIRNLIGRKRRGDSFEFILDSIRKVQTDFTFFMKSFFFVLLGVTFDLTLLGKISPFLIAGIIIMIIFSRYISATILSRMDKAFAAYRGLISVMIPRGYVAAVLAFVPASEGIAIPFFTDIVVILVILTTFISIGGVIIYARSKTYSK